MRISDQKRDGAFLQKALPDLRSVISDGLPESAVRPYHYFKNKDDLLYEIIISIRKILLGFIPTFRVLGGES
jgi:hypothetical protein